MAIYEKTFSNADLNGSYQLELTHNLSNLNVIPIWYDDSGIQQSSNGIFQIIDSNNVVLNCNDVITGTHKLLLQYDAGTPAITGTKLFEKSLATPDDAMRLAFGAAGQPTINAEWSEVKALLQVDSNFLVAANNLSDLTDIENARSALSVYSTSEVNAFLAAKAQLYQSGSGSVLGVTNTLAFNPTGDYHPATKKYVDENIELATPAYTTTGIIDSDVTLDYFSIWNYGKLIIITGRVEVAIASPSAYLQILQVDSASLRPANYRYAAAAPFDGANRNPGVVRMDSNGILSIAPGSVTDILYYAFNLVYTTV